MVLEIIPYSTEWEEKWNKFVLNDSVNGTFLQTRNFLNYHPEGKFEDASLIILNKSNIVAVIPACVSEEAEGKCFYSHKGSTFGGIILNKQKYKISTLEELYPCLERYLREKKFYSIYIKNTSDVFSKERNDLFDYYFYKNDYNTINEVSFYIDCERINEKDITSTWSSGRRRDYRYSLNSELNFRHIANDVELNSFYMILKENLSRHDAKPVHTLKELIDLRDKRIPDIVDYYGVFHNEQIIAGTMIFRFGKNVLHTQYLAQDITFSDMFPMNFLNYNLIKLAKEEGFKRFSFGISTENRGKILNIGLALFKEGFGTQYCNNKSYYKKIM